MLGILTETKNKPELQVFNDNNKCSSAFPVCPEQISPPNKVTCGARQTLFLLQETVFSIGCVLLKWSFEQERKYRPLGE